MALETSTLVNGEWTTRTLDVNSVLQHYDQQDKEATAKAVDIEEPPVYGLLSQTVIRSPQAHWILPVKLRSPNNNDVAFVGEDFVQVRELQSDGHLCDVIRKENFGAKIHNVRVIGSENAYRRDPDTPYHHVSPTKNDDDDADMRYEAGRHLREQLNLPRPSVEVLPPQALVLHLDSGDFVFMYLRQTESGGLEFISTRRRVAKPMLSSPVTRAARPNEPERTELHGAEIPSRARLSSLQAGMHLAVDPSSRYMAIGCSQDLFAIYALHPRSTMKKQWREHVTTGTGLKNVEAERYIPLPGVIHKMEFLYPAPDDEDHIILIILVVRGGKTRMIVYEWQAGMDLRKIGPHSKRGHLLEESKRMPLLLIPLIFKSAFILVSETSLSICQNILAGSPTCVEFDTDIDPPTKLHQGRSGPLWVSWARPIRTHQPKGRDHIYLAREDGLVKFYELDSEELVDADMTVGQFDCSISPAFASLEYQKVVEPFKGGDLLMTSGDACNGGTYLVLARASPSFNEGVPNWSPSIDFITTAQSQDRHFDEPYQHKTLLPKRDRIFVCSGTGIGGAITELRFGLEASIGAVIPYGTPILNAWVLSPVDTPSADHGLLFLLSFGNFSAIVKLSNDAVDAEAVDQSETPFDLGNRTISAKAFGTWKVQVTEKSIIVMSGMNHRTYEGPALLESSSSIEHAVICNGLIVFTTSSNAINRIHLLAYSNDHTLRSTQEGSALNDANPRVLLDVPSQIYSIATGWISQVLCVIFATSIGSFMEITFQPAVGGAAHTLRISAAETGSNSDAIISLAIPDSSSSIVTILCGTRNGFLITLHADVSDSIQLVDTRFQRLGATSVIITKDEHTSSREAYFASCDAGIYSFTPRACRQGVTLTKGPAYQRIDQIWMTDALNPTIPQPEGVSVARLPDTFGHSEGGNMLVVAGSELILARLSPQSKPIPRRLAIGGTPKRIMYSQDLGLLIVAAIVDKKTTLLFIDPDTGTDLSEPVDKSGAAVQYVSGLGKEGETILGLLDWAFMKDGAVWKYLVVTTSSGRVLLISYDKDVSQNETPRAQSKIRFRTRYKFRHDEQVCAVTGFPEGLFYCSGTTLCCDTLDLVEKRFKRVASYSLSSPARCLTYENGRVYAMTTGHSLEVLKVQTDQGVTQIVPTHFDENQRAGLHHLEVGLEPQLSLISDSDASVTGLWATRNTKADTLNTVFEAEMQHSVQRFRIGRCRPIWDVLWPVSTARQERMMGSTGELYDQFDLIPTSRAHAEIFGLAIDGSLSHFTILGVAAWRFLRFILNLSIRSPAICQFTYELDLAVEPTLNPKTRMHIDGDILKRCIEEQRLEELLGSIQEEHAMPVFDRFVELLQELHGGKLEKNASQQAYIAQAYLDLEFYLRPVL
ncbi:hypothetical protein BP6252_13490 [Coleophoma cylindrospora]|uniref:RSE1/DDB1/CPSF1 first beta-propeller domain-containing protein n=1 Tax=Coleophoma cylindrospora TaxID=1849047 RepID=A0A3D8Q8E6_9HELO|nr:hypothetical protein BP6252_13490 [Coleophoma cylindrospora]